MAYVFAGLAGWFFASTLRYRKKLKDLQGEYDKRCKELTNAECEIKGLNGVISKHKVTELFGRNNLTWLEEIPSIASQKFIHYAKVMVIGQDKDCGFYFIVKIFLYDINDPSDREFAIREAEELIETIQKF